MHIHVCHETTYHYEQPVRSLVQVLRLTPRSHESQHVRHWQIEPSAGGALRMREDSLGNITHVFSAEGPLQTLSLRVTGAVETHDVHGFVRGTVERVPDLFYLRSTHLAQADEALALFATEAAGDVAADPLAALHRLLAALHAEVAFDTAPTTASTTAAEAFALRRGVCQDLTHIFIACCRHLDIPARYVSGYFHRADGVIRQEAGHAWAEAKVPGFGWIGFDPANGICTTDAHIRVAIGLDYLGAAPIRGSRAGGGAEVLDVNLVVADAAQRQGQVQGQGQQNQWQQSQW